MSDRLPLLILTMLGVLSLMAFWRLILLLFVAAGVTVFAVGLIQVTSWINAVL